MFASALSPNLSHRQAAGAYRQVHASTGVDNATPHGLIALLFDGALDAISEARGAMRSRNLQLKIKAIGRALRIVDEGLASALNDEAGGQLATDLRALYGYITMRLAQANLGNDESALEECARLIEPLRSGWADIAELVAV